MKYTIYLLFSLLLTVFACQNSNKAAKKAPKANTTAAPSYNSEIKPLLQRLLPHCEKVEYVFYKQGMSFATELGNKQNILAYFNHISDQEVPKHTCKYDAGAVFRSPDGDIVLTADFVLNDPKCKSAVVTAEGKSYYQKMNDSGFKHLMYFYNIDQQQGGQLVPK